MRTTEIKCDKCGKDLTYTGNCEDYYLTLGSAPKVGRGNFRTLMAVTPPIDREHHFCNLACLDKWRDGERMFDSLMATKWEIWKREHGTSEFGGAVKSYPSPGEDIYAAWVAECRAAANANT